MQISADATTLISHESRELHLSCTSPQDWSCYYKENKTLECDPVSIPFFSDEDLQSVGQMQYSQTSHCFKTDVYVLGNIVVFTAILLLPTIKA